jgi:hypothetical protein
VAKRQIDAGSDPQYGLRTFDVFWMDQAATQTTRKVAWANYWDEIETAHAIQGLPKERLTLSFGDQDAKIIGDVE